MSLADDDTLDVWWHFPAGGKPVRVGDSFRICADIRFGGRYRFVRVDDDYVEVVAADDDATSDLDTFLCQPASEAGAIAFVLLPRLAS